MYKSDYKMWESVLRAEQTVDDRAPCDVQRTDQARPDREAGKLGEDNNFEYRLNGRFTGDTIYEPASDRFYPEFLLTGYEVINRQPVGIYLSKSQENPDMRIIMAPVHWRRDSSRTRASSRQQATGSACARRWPNGADAVFFGLSRFNARMRADNFREEELPTITTFLHAHGVKAYVTLNVLIFTDELDDAIARASSPAQCGRGCCHHPGCRACGSITPHVSRFACSCLHTDDHHLPGGRAFCQVLGVKQVVLARELSLRELEKFPPSVPLETFVHGALCVAYSGQCLTSETLGRRSAIAGSAPRPAACHTNLWSMDY
jgi:hypothetical protein